MRKSELLSKEWCDLIFKDRNQEYGAYRIRRNAGRRYRFALLVTSAGIFLAVCLPFALDLYAKYKTFSELKDIEADIKQLKRLDEKEGFKTRRISAGRGLPAVSTIKDAHDDTPDIVEQAKRDIIFGKGGPETVIVSETTVAEDRDTLHNRERTDLPVEGPQLTAVEVVEEMPQFPGGHKALMEWLDEHIPYPSSCIRKKIEGDMEVTFIIDSQGRVLEPEVSKSLHPALDRVALGALKVMPPWTPGKAGGRVSAVRVTIPLHFQLR